MATERHATEYDVPSILAERLARGQITEEEYDRLLAKLRVLPTEPEPAAVQLSENQSEVPPIVRPGSSAQVRADGRNWYFEVWRKFATFQGRARRKEYWWFTLANFGVFFLAGLIETILGVAADSQGILPGIYMIVVFLPSLAVTVRRLHDTGRSGWWVLLALVPLLGLILLVFLVSDSEPGRNRFGANPKFVGRA